MKRLMASNNAADEVIEKFRDECKIIFDDIRNNGDRRVPVLYGYWLSPIIYKPKQDCFILEFTDIDAPDDVYNYSSFTFNYDDVMHYHYNKALEKFLETCELVYRNMLGDYSL